MKISLYDIIKIAPIENIELSIEYDLAFLIIKNETELHRFSGKNSFVTELKNKSYVFDKKEVYEDYRHLSRLLYSLKNNMLNYNRYVQSKNLYPNLKFIYQESWDDNDGGNLTGTEFKKLDGLILPLDHKVWRKIYPPNHVNDNCSIMCTREKCNRRFIFNLPKAKGAFNYDFIKLYYQYKHLIKQDENNQNISNNSTSTVFIDINSLIEKAINEVYGDRFKK